MTAIRIHVKLCLL